MLTREYSLLAPGMRQPIRVTTDPRFCGLARKLLKKGGVVYVLGFGTTLSPTSRLG